MGKSVSVLIPYRASDSWRTTSFEFLVQRYQALFPDFEICVGDSGGSFCRSEAKNKAFGCSSGDILIINDADTIWEPDCIKEAIALVSERNVWALPFVNYYNLSQRGTLDVFYQHPGTLFQEKELEADICVDEKNHPPDGSVGGVLVLPRAAFEEVGGYDERFRTWGYEDDSFALALDTVWSNHFRVEGYVAHLWHPPAADGDFNHPEIHENRSLWQKYQKAYGNTTIMHDLLVR